MMPKLPQKITVDLPGQRLLIDGEEMHWAIEAGGIDVLELGSREGIAVVQIRLLTRTAEVIPAAPPG
jgi:hypothetical protein